MDAEISLTLGILSFAVVFFVTGWLPVDLTALLVLSALAITNLLTPAEALSGFSSPAVVTVWAVFILSGSLSRTGIADMIGRQVLRLSGKNETRLIIVIMVTAGVMSAFMNNVGVAALMLPVVLTIARQTGNPPSRLLLPLAYATLLGGLTTLIGTPPNILTADIMRDFGLTPFRLFDFAPVGLAIMLAGILFMIVLGRRLLRTRDPLQALSEKDHEGIDVQKYYGLAERLTLIELPADSPLAGLTLAQSRIGRALGITILGLQRQGQKQLNIRPDTLLAGKDCLLALGRIDRLEELRKQPFLIVEEQRFKFEQLLSSEIGLAELTLEPDSVFAGKTIAELEFRQVYGMNVLMIQRGDKAFRVNLQDIPLSTGDTLLLQGSRETLERIGTSAAFQKGFNILVQDAANSASDIFQERLLKARIPSLSPLAGASLLDSRLAELFGLVVLGIVRQGETFLAPMPDFELAAEDMLLLVGQPQDLAVLRGLAGLKILQNINTAQVILETEEMGLVEAVLSPRSAAIDKTLREIHIREKYELSVLAIWRQGRAYRTNLADMKLQLGDAFLLYGPHTKINIFGKESNFLLLTDKKEEAPHFKKALPAGLTMLGVVLVVLLGWLPISIAAIAGAALMVLFGALKMTEAYQAIDWRAVFLIACMLPLGIALEQSGAARLLAESMVDFVGDFGPYGLIAGFFILTNLASQFMPNPVVTVLMAPVAINTAVDLNLSPVSLLMVVAIAASASFMSPVGHPANVLVMGPGGYQFRDYIRVGAPLTLVTLLITLLVLPIFWPLYP